MMLTQQNLAQEAHFVKPAEPPQAVAAPLHRSSSFMSEGGDGLVLAPSSPPPTVEPPRKRLKATPSWLEGASTLRSLLLGALPDKEILVDKWLAALSAPSVCITSLEDVRRLDHEDITGLPVPPLVKGVLRKTLDREISKAQEEAVVLHATLARKREFFMPLRDRNMQPALAGSKYFQGFKDYRLILTHEEIQAGVRIVARRLEAWCKGERIVLVAILKGAFMFLSDLCRALTRPYSVFFVEASSYKAGRSAGNLEINQGSDITGAKFRDATSGAPHKIVLIDELLDNGQTMQEMKQHFLQRLSATHTENDVLTVCLFSKQRERSFPQADVTGIPNLPDLWLVGYGLDDRGTKRGWTDLFAMPKVKIVETVDEDEVKKLLEKLDSAAVLTGPLVFAGFELGYREDKQRYRVSGVDVQGRQEQTRGPGSNEFRKADLEKLLGNVPLVKGKYEQELRFAFILEDVRLVPEDDIFTGDTQAYGSMRCSLRRQITVGARRFGVEGLGPLEPPSGGSSR